VPKSKKFGGVKRLRRENIPAVTATPKRFGNVKEPVLRGVTGMTGFVQSCPQNCGGEYKFAMWIHSAECPWAAVLWSAHGKTRDDWNCPYHCEPTALPSGWTHDYRCPFWDRTGATPIDVLPPKAHDDTKEKDNRKSGKDNSDRLPLWSDSTRPGLFGGVSVLAHSILRTRRNL